MGKLSLRASLFLIFAGICVTEGTNTYENNCQEFQRKVLDLYGPFVVQYHWYPKCLEGGYWQNVQCEPSGCFCAYLDTGRRIPDTYYHAMILFMQESCPMISYSTSDPCANPPEDYPCRETSRRYYYDAENDKCEGKNSSCLGFDSLNLCKKSCVIQKRDRCNFKMSNGRECDKRDPTEKWFHDEEKGTCRPFLYNGCGGNSNKYQEKWECLKTCESKHQTDVILQIETTKYIVRIPTWVVVQMLLMPSEVNKLSVEQFKTMEDDMVEISKFSIEEDEEEGEEEGSAMPTPTEPPVPFPYNAEPNMTRWDICALEMDPGPCRAFAPRWYFSSKESKCIRFIYGLCYGNGNNFKTATHCADFCEAEIRPSEAELFMDKVGLVFGLFPPPPKPDNKDEEDDESDERSLQFKPDLGGTTESTVTTTEKTETVIEKQSETEFTLYIPGSGDDEP